MTLAPRGAPDETESRLLEVFRISPGARVLDIGCDDGALAAELARRGAGVLALQPDPELAAIAQARLAGAGDARIERMGLAGWLSSPDRSDGTFDLVLTRAEAAAHGRQAVERDLEAAIPLVEDSGVLLILADGGGLRELVEGTPSSGTSPDPSGEEGPASGGHERVWPDWMRGWLAERGLDHQRWFVAYPDRRAASVVVSGRLWAMPDGDVLIKALVREPFPRTGLVPPLVMDPLEAFQRHANARRWTELARSVVIVAGREREPVTAVGREGLLWLLRPAGAPGWASTRELVEDGGAWSFRAVGPLADARSGPLASAPVETSVAVGQNGEDVLASRLLGWGASSERSRSYVRAWWAAALEVVTAPANEGRQFDVRPRNFVVTPAGEWRFMAQELVVRFPVPPGVLAFRALEDLVRRRVAHAGWMPGLPLDASVRDAVSDILDGIDLRPDNAILQLWVELEADILIRTEGRQDDVVSVRDEVQARLDEPLRRSLPGLPLSRHVEAGRELAERAREIDVLREEIARATASPQPPGSELEPRPEPELQPEPEPEQSPEPPARSRSAPTRQRAAASPRYSVNAPRRRRARARILGWLGRGRILGWLGGRLGEPRARAELRASGLLDADWYRARYPDVAASGMDPALHYLRYGAAEGRDPSPGFDTRGYLARYPDVARQALNPLLHYVRHGAAEGRIPRERREPGEV
jgi:SAM-dependent methyltransferase